MCVLIPCSLREVPRAENLAFSTPNLQLRAVRLRESSSLSDGSSHAGIICLHSGPCHTQAHVHTHKCNHTGIFTYLTNKHVSVRKHAFRYVSVYTSMGTHVVYYLVCIHAWNSLRQSPTQPHTQVHVNVHTCIKCILKQICICIHDCMT